MNTQKNRKIIAIIVIFFEIFVFLTPVKGLDSNPANNYTLQYYFQSDFLQLSDNSSSITNFTNYDFYNDFGSHQSSLSYYNNSLYFSIFEENGTKFCNISLIVWGKFISTKLFYYNPETRIAIDVNNQTIYGKIPFQLPSIPMNQELFEICSYKNYLFMNGYPDSSWYEKMKGYASQYQGTIFHFDIYQAKSDDPSYYSYTYEKHTKTLVSMSNIKENIPFPLFDLLEMKIEGHYLKGFLGRIVLIEKSVDFKPFVNYFLFFFIGSVTIGISGVVVFMRKRLKKTHTHKYKIKSFRH